MGPIRVNQAFLILCLACCAVALSGCFRINRNNEAPIARVFDKHLYLSDIQGIFPESASASDSTILIKAYTDRWVRRQLMVYRAEMNLAESEKNVKQQLEDYRSSLLIFKYEQEFIHQKLDTIITHQEIEKFYTDNISNFILSENLVKALFIKLKRDDPYSDRIRNLYRSSHEEDIKTLDNLAYQVAIKYDYFNDTWVPFTLIMNELPEVIANPEQFLARNSHIAMEDEKYTYLVGIRDAIIKGGTSPLSYEYENVKSIILNKRKHRLISDLEVKIYNDGLNHNHFTVYLD